MDETLTRPIGPLPEPLAPGWTVRVLESPDRAQVDREWPLEGPLVLGRRGGAGLDLPLADPGLSRQHLRLEPRRGSAAVTLSDLGSKNGTFLEGQRVTVGKVAAGAWIRAGESLLWVGPSGGPAEPGRGVGQSAAWTQVVRLLDRVATSELSVLLLGPTGVGKEVLARRLHEKSGRTGAFEAINCAAIPESLAESLLFGHAAGAFTGAARAREGVFVAADRGTLFLDEVGELPLPLQAKLLRAVETGQVRVVGGRDQQVRVRLVAATCVDLAKAKDEGRFRPDFYARLAGLELAVPALSERREDILTLGRALLAEAGFSGGWTTDFAEALLRRPWPGNVRELRAALQRAALLSGEPTLGAAAVAFLGAPAEPPAGEGAAPSIEVLRALLAEHGGRVSAVAAALDKDRKQVYRWMRRYGLDPEAHRG
jgi:DNA-binding NtrC family response regulator